MDKHGRSYYSSYPMASIWKHPKSQYWTAHFVDANGRRLKRSTKSTDRKTATKLAEQFEEAARKKRTLKQAQSGVARPSPLDCG